LRLDCAASYVVLRRALVAGEKWLEEHKARLDPESEMLVADLATPKPVCNRCWSRGESS